MERKISFPSGLQMELEASSLWFVPTCQAIRFSDTAHNITWRNMVEPGRPVGIKNNIFILAYIHKTAPHFAFIAVIFNVHYHKFRL